jgi:uncharacterized secreted protein with C-terminal beta-propeller domain
MFMKQLAEKASVVSLVILALLCLLACTGTEVGNPRMDDTADITEVNRFSGDSELENYLKEQYADSLEPMDVMMIMAPEDDAGGLSGATGGQSDTSGVSTASGDHSTTNVQETGVDESDMVKTDGTTLYAAGDRAVHIVDLADDMRLLTSLPVDGWIDGLYLEGDLLIVLYTPDTAQGEPWTDMALPANDALFGMCYWVPVKIQQAVVFYDISIPAVPVLRKALAFDGRLVSSRLVDEKLHIVQQYLPNLPPIELTYDGSQSDRDAKVNANRLALADIHLDDLTPHYQVMGEPIGAPQPTVFSDQYYRPVGGECGGTITTVVSFDLSSDDLPFTSVGMVADAHMVYASTKSLFIISQAYAYGSVDSERATLFKYDLTGDTVRCVAIGTVPGWILNQFSMSEYEDVLRVATTTGRVGDWSQVPHNRVLCLQQEDKALNIVGRIENIAPGEQIYSARFLGERGFLVTFVKIDPLFTLDLSDPLSPAIIGELKVPGYSDYIHPLGKDHLLTIGKDTLFVPEDNMAWFQGVQLSIFDVGDFENPSLQDKVVIGDRPTSSEASGNHKAFTFWPEHNLLAIPIHLYEFEAFQDSRDPWEYGTFTFSGLYVYEVTTDTGFDFKGRISTQPPSQTYGSARWTRGLFVDRYVYAVTEDALKSAEIENIESSIRALYYDDPPASE